MDNKAVVYTSNTGTTKEYAEMIGAKYNLPVYDMDDALRNLEKDDEIIYLGWILSGDIQGFPRADSWFKVNAVCAVGVGATGTQVGQLMGKNEMEQKLFTLQGGLYLDRLKGMNKIMMKVFSKSVLRGYKGMKDIPEDEASTLDLFKNGGSKVSEDNLKAFYTWYENQM